ncbi:hypothetical protein SAMN05444156_3090 [Verrucomicrobium sp. GAS474]|uniref:hypothetical protein n=1 Tax=Verrucomicrobium sp. GAS474 TaxID=1882831 RepID=UPI000879F869|nr:hypothetical protein [Verrucomicrobium sp. GAS474]SDU28891.1 hypothetical protein SAMN05444156_3090 [Verrucomicrobium sp. GAS474]
MSRNRVKEVHSLQLAAVLKWVVVGLTLCLFGGSYVYEKNEVMRLATEVRNQDNDLRSWKRRNQQMQDNITRISSYDELRRRLAAMNSGMVRIGELKVVQMENGRVPISSIARNNSGGGMP